jgi:hypothetical protein
MVRESLHATATRLQDQLLNEVLAAPGLLKELAGIESLISETYLNRVQYELLQNSDDAGATEVVITFTPKGTATWANDGRPFTAEDLESLCRSAVSTKTRGDAIGYRGIGFKSVAAACERVDVTSDDATFTFSRHDTEKLLHLRGFASHNDVPMIRIPTSVELVQASRGASFTMHGCRVQLDVNPLALLFLRNIRRVTLVDDAGNRSSARCTKIGSTACLETNGVVAEFELREGNKSLVGIPLNDSALALVRSKGMLACFLPLNDEIGLPIIVSGDLLTDPSRSHAVLEDPTTIKVLEDAASLVAGILGTRNDKLHELLWDLMIRAEDPRAYLLEETKSSMSTFWSLLAAEFKRSVGFTIQSIPVQLTREDAALLAIQTVPGALALADNRIQVRALKSVFQLQEVDLPQMFTKATLDKLHPATRDRLRGIIQSNAELTGRALSMTEQSLVEDSQNKRDPSVDALSENKGQSPAEAATPNLSIREVLQKWRAVEVAVKEFLNAQGWQLADVSSQNLGYDLEGFDNKGLRAVVEVKSLHRIGDPLMLTNNEMSTMHTASDCYWAALVIDSGGSTQLAMVNLKSANLTFDKVCRRWDWESTDWRAKAVIVGGS